jgi:hypothetical protein
MNPVEVKSGENTSTPPKYIPPLIEVLDEKDLLSTFQVSVNAVTWWGGM